jgi:hypothetical protein
MVAIRSWFYEHYPSSGFLMCCRLCKNPVYVLLNPRFGFNGLVIEFSADLETDTDILNDIAERGYMSVVCKNEDQIKETIASYLSYE